MKCDCGHSADHHNPGDPYEGIKDDFSGNCRNCTCLMFTRELQLEGLHKMATDQLMRKGLIAVGELDKDGLIARERGEVIVRRWQDEIDAIKAEHQNDVAQFQVLLKEAGRLQRISNKKIVKLELALKESRRLNRSFTRNLVKLEAALEKVKL